MATIAVDIGGTKIAAGIITDDAPTTVHARHVLPTPASEGAAAVVATILRAIEAVRRHFSRPVHRIGVGAPGVVNNGVVTYAGPTMTGWQGTDLVAALTEATGLPVAVHNDVRVMGLGEALYGKDPSEGDTLFVSIGTGIGGAIIGGDGRLPASPHGNRGELAYLLGPTPEGGCAPIETVGAGPAIAAAYGADSLHPVMERYRQGDQRAREIVDGRLSCVGQALGAFVNAYDVAAIVLGGGVGTLPEALAPFSSGVRGQLLSSLGDVRITQATLGTNAPLVGAAHLAREETT